MSLTGNNFSLIWQKILTAVPGPAFHKLLLSVMEKQFTLLFPLLESGGKRKNPKAFKVFI